MVLGERFISNPVLRPEDLKPLIQGAKIECLLNPGVFRYRGKIWLLLRVAERPQQQDGKISFPINKDDGSIEIISIDTGDKDLDFSDPRVIHYKGKDYLTTLSHLRLVCSDDGISFYEPDGYLPLTGMGSQESFGIEDCRVATMGDGFHLTYTKVSPYAVGVGYMFTKNWKKFEGRTMIFPPHNKDCAIFEEKIGGKYYALHRPSSPELGGNYIWIAESPDLLHWGNHQLVAATRKGHWDGVRVGAGAAPIKTSKGWLEIYHGADENNRYCLGLLLLDLQNPAKVLARSKQPVMVPSENYEKTGFFGNVVFTNGHYRKDDVLYVYYGASDEVICGIKFSVTELLNSLD